MRFLIKAFFLVFLLLAASAAGIWYWANQPLTLKTSPLDFRVTPGSSLRAAIGQMRDAGIADGDELVVDRGVAAEDGRIVVADIDGELTVKRLKRTATGWLLQAANPDYADIPVGDKSEMNIWGVVTRVLHAV